jgi:hypothetical protein
MASIAPSERSTVYTLGQNKPADGSSVVSAPVNTSIEPSGDQSTEVMYVKSELTTATSLESAARQILNSSSVTLVRFPLLSSTHRRPATRV